MFEDTNLAASILANPASVQNLVLTEFQNRLGGVYSVADPNNSFNLLLEASSSMNAQSVILMESQFLTQYAVRATTAEQLYNSMSDFDYLNMVAGPSSTNVYLTFNVDYLIQNAISYDTTYNRIVIPVGTQFYIGPLTFGIYYPINININKVTNNINVLWDTTIENPLYSLPTNMVPFSVYSNGGLNLITLTVPVTQFALTTNIYPVVQQQGFSQNLSYTNNFYAARVFTNLPIGSWTELSYTLSETIYDPTEPTAKLKILNDTNTLSVSIPQIYFTNGQIGNQVMIMLYTTAGELSLDLTSVEVASCNVDFGLNSGDVTAYSTILANLATIDLTPAEPSITGGSNALTFQQLRDLVINGGLYTSVPVTPAQLSAYAAKSGFTITKHLDNVTDRVYYASNTILGGQNKYIMVTTGDVTVVPSNVNSTTSIINFPDDNAITILPTTIYSCNNQTNNFVPLTDTQVSILTNMPAVSFADNVNTNTYTKCPFHLVTYTASQYPITKSFNLMNPSVNTIRFIEDNVFLTPQMSVVSAIVIHNNNGTGGYTLRLGVTKTPAMQVVAETDITVYISAKDVNNIAFYGIAKTTGTIGTLTVYELDIPTTYYISQTGNFRSLMTTVEQNTTEPLNIPLETTFTVTFLLTPSLYPNVAQNVNLVEDISSIYNTKLGVCRQQLDVIFGIDLSSQIYNNTNALWTGTQYATYPETVYLTYPNDVYQTNADGGLIYSVSNGELVLNKLHNKGDQILDINGSPIVQYEIGSLKLDSENNPIVLTTRQLNYYVSTLMFDLRLFYSSNTADIAFASNLTSTLMTYLNTLSEVQNNLLEQTDLYYMPNSTMGTAQFSAGNNTPLSLNLGFGFALTVYVTQATLTNINLQATLISDIIAIIQTEVANPVISLTDIAQIIRTQFSDIILSVDVNGIDAIETLQTVIAPVGTEKPIISQKLVYDQNNTTLSLQPDIKIVFALAA